MTVTIKLDKATYAKGDTVTATVVVTAIDGSTSISVNAQTGTGVVQVATATATIPPPPPPPPPPSTTRFGSSVPGSGDYQRLAQLGLTCKAVRVFFSSGPPKRWGDHSVLAGLPKDVEVVLSWKGGSDAELKSFFATMPAGTVCYGSFWHEPEDNVEGGSLALSDWQAKQDSTAPVLRSVGVIPCMILMGYTLHTKNRNPADYFRPKSHDAVFFDAYNAGNKHTPPGYSDPVKLIKVVSDYAKSVSRPWGLTETGSPVINSVAERAKWAEGLAKAGAAAKAECMIWWDQSNPGFDASIDSAVAKVWHG